jgi:formylglycine-generating enzyme required for sulfatase activity
MMRGGSWFSRPRYCRSACRNCNRHSDRDDCNGCRVLLDLDNQK